MPDVDQCIALLQERGHSEYGGEAVTQLEHALQSALLAEQESAPVALIAAALLHDVLEQVPVLAQPVAPHDERVRASQG